MSEQIDLRRKETNSKILEDFLGNGWLHPVFILPKKRSFLRISGPVQVDLEEDGEAMVDTIRSEFPKSSLVGAINHFVAGKAKRQGQTKLNLKQQKPFEISKVVDQNRIQFERYLEVERIATREVEQKVEEQVIGALTDFDVNRKQSKVINDDDTETKESMSPEEMEKRRVDDFRRKFKDELDSLKSELNDLQGTHKLNVRGIKESQRETS